MYRALWLLGSVLADAGLLASPWLHSSSTHAYLAVLSTHALASAMATEFCIGHVPRELLGRRFFLRLLLFNFAFIAPMLGAIGMAYVLHITLGREHRRSAKLQHASMALPEYDVQGPPAQRSAQGSIRSRLDSSVPDAVRMQSLLTLQAVPQRVANPILENLLGDSTDDIRMVAFGMLDAEEKKINGSIALEMDALARANSQEQRHSSLRKLAELHWELVYASLASGELRDHILATAQGYIQEALALPLPKHSGLLYLQARIMMGQGRLEQAQDLFQQALHAGHPAVSVYPYLGEIAYLQREFAVVTEYMRLLAQLRAAKKSGQTVDYWLHRGTDADAHAHKHPNHI